MYCDVDENASMLPALPVGWARKGVNYYECIALNLPVPVRAGTYLVYVVTGWALFVFALMMLNDENTRSTIMSKESIVPEYAVMGNRIYVDFQPRDTVLTPAEIEFEQKIINLINNHSRGKGAAAPSSRYARALTDGVRRINDEDRCGV